MDKRDVGLVGLITIMVFVLRITSASGPVESAGTNEIFLPIVQRQESFAWLGPEGGHIVSIQVDRTDPGILYAGTWGSGVYRSADGGQSWQLASEGLDVLYINSLALHPSNDAILYAGTQGGGVYKTIDSGETWSPTGVMFDQAIVYDLEIDQNAPDTVYAATRRPSTLTSGGGVYKTTNGGTSWTPANTGLSEEVVDDTNYGIYIYDLAIDPNNSDILYLASHGLGVYKSTNAGSSWVQKKSGLTDLSTRSVVIDPSNSNNVYVGTWHSTGVFKSTDGAGSWSPAASGLPFDVEIYQLSLDEDNPQILYASTYRTGVYKTINGAGSWGPAGLEDDFVYTVEINPLDDSQVFAGTFGNGVFESPDSASNWKRSNAGLIATSVTGLVQSTTTPGDLYASIYGGGVYHSSDHGAHWEAVNYGLGERWVHTIAIDPTDPLRLYVGTEGAGVYRTLNGGGLWTQIGTGFPTFTTSTFGYQAPRPFPRLEEEDPAFQLDFDPGEADWKGFSVASGTNVSVQAISIDPSNPAILYAGTRKEGVYKSADGGGSWAYAGLGGKTINALAMDPTDPCILFAGVSSDDGTAFKSVNSGDNWNSIVTGISGRTIYALAVDPSNPAVVYAGTDEGVYRSLNGGASWSATSLVDKIYAVAVDPGSSNIVLAGGMAGSYVSSDNGGTWERDEDGMLNNRVQVLLIDPALERKFAGTEGNGGYRWNRMLP